MKLDYVTTDPNNNIGRYCDISGESSGRDWKVVARYIDKDGGYLVKRTVGAPLYVRRQLFELSNVY